MKFIGYHSVLLGIQLYSSNHKDAATYSATYIDAYTGPENKYHVLEISISNITRYCLINFHYVYRVCTPNATIII